MIRFADYAPDQPGYFSGGAPVIKNVIPTASGYRPFQGFFQLSSALSGEPKGYFSALLSDGTVVIIAATIDKLYRLDTSDFSWDEVSRLSSTYTGNETDGWSFAIFGSRIIATNGVDEVQYYDIGSSTDFDDLAGSPPLAKYVTVIGDYVVLYGLANNLNRIAWSGTNDSESWTYGEANSGYQDFPEGGEIVFVSAVERNAIILQKQKSRYMAYTPENSFLWQFREIEDRGAVSHRSCVTNGTQVFYLAEDGFFTLSPAGQSAPIGAERVDKTVQDDVSALSNLQAVSASNDPNNKLVVWLYSTTGSTPDKALAFAWQLNKWVELSLGEVYYLSEGFSTAQTLEQIAVLFPTVEEVPVSFDSPRWLGGKPVFAGFDSSYRLGFFDGDNLEATLETADLSFAEGKRARVRGFRPITDAAGVYGRVGVKQTWSGTVAWGSEFQASTSTGRCVANSTGYTGRFRCRIASGETWTGIAGIDAPEITALGGL